MICVFMCTFSSATKFVRARCVLVSFNSHAIHAYLFIYLSIFTYKLVSGYCKGCYLLHVCLSFIYRSRDCIFYRATPCVSAVFAVVRCLSVRPSATLVLCIQKAEDILKLLCRPGSPSF